MLALRSMCIMFRELWGEWKRLHVKAVTLAGHWSMTCWARRRRLRGTAGSQCGGLGVVFNTQERRPGRAAVLWAVVCGKVKNQASFLELSVTLLDLRMAPRSSKSPCSSLSLKLCWGVWMSSLISMQSESEACTGCGGDEGVEGGGLVKLWG